jgi:hypothetical protein
MTTSTIDRNGRMERKTLSSQIDRLDCMLEGLAENLNEAVAFAVKETVTEVVRNAVELAVKKVLGNPDLLRAALAQHVPSAPTTEPKPPRPEPRSIAQMVKGGWTWLCQKVTQTVSCARDTLSCGFTWLGEKLRNRWVAKGIGTIAALGAVGLTLWHLRRSVAIAWRLA